MDLLLALTLVASSVAAIGPTGVELERLIDTSVQLPGTTEPLVFDGPAFVPCGRGVVFRAAESGASNSWAYYVTSDGVEVFVDEETTIPGTLQGFQDLAEIRCVAEDRYVFLGWGGTSSLYDWLLGGQIHLIQSGDTAVDGHDFGDLVGVGANHSGAGILGRLEPQSLGEALMFKPFEGDSIFVADTDAIMPGQTDPVTSYGPPVMTDSDLIFRARTFPNAGLYRWSEGFGVIRLVDTDTPVPGAPGTFLGIGQPVVLTTGIAFGASYSHGSGIFLLDNGGQIEPLVVPGQTTAGGDTILSAYNPSGAGGLIAFRGTTVETDPLPSVFARTASGQIHRILGIQDVIEGQTVVLVDAGADDRRVVIRVDTLERDPEGIIYRANFGTTVDIPSLSWPGAVALAAALFLTGLWSLRRRRVH